MTYEEVMAQLKALGSEQNVKIYRRHGAGDNLFGVSFANLKKLEKQIRKNQSLAEELWKSGNTDARTLATMIADPEKIKEQVLEAWLVDITYYALVDAFVSNLVCKTRFAEAKMRKWIASEDEWVGRAGWHLLAKLAMNENSLKNDFFVPYLAIVEQKIHSSKNRTREAMNNALIAIGIRNPILKQKALAVAEKVGKVHVDHGQTSCKTNDALEYIERVSNRDKDGDQHLATEDSIEQVEKIKKDSVNRKVSSTMAKTKSSEQPKPEVKSTTSKPEVKAEKAPKKTTKTDKTVEKTAATSEKKPAKKAEEKKAEPKKAEAKKAEPKKVEAKKAEPKKSEAKKTK